MSALPLFLHLDPTLREPLHAQVYRGLRQAIADGRIAATEYLPSTRRLAQDLRVGRNTVLRALDRLKAEGIVEGQVGSGVRVGRSAGAAKVVDTSLCDRDEPSRVRAAARPFNVDSSPRDVFPVRAWARMAARKWRASPVGLFDSDDPSGHAPLRRIIAEYLRRARGIACRAEQVVITSGSRHAMEIMLRAVTAEADGVWVENPGRLDVRRALEAVNARTIPVPIDREGFNPTLASRCGHATVAIVAPGCHFPSGIPLSLKRRNQLVAWVQSTGGWIIEDDRLSVTRFVGRPQPTLYSLDDSGHTVFVGSFVHVLFPGLRVGYAVVPDAIGADRIVERQFGEQHAPTSTQAILAEFIESGQFAQHLRHLRDVIAQRHSALVHALSAHCGTFLDPWPASAGTHVLGWLPNGSSESAIAGAAARRGVDVQPLSAYCYDAARPGLVLGFGRWSARELTTAAKGLATAFHDLRTASGSAGIPA